MCSIYRASRTTALKNSLPSRARGRARARDRSIRGSAATPGRRKHDVFRAAWALVSGEQCDGFFARAPSVLEQLGVVDDLIAAGLIQAGGARVLAVLHVAVADRERSQRAA